jgi:hypothetical protein
MNHEDLLEKFEASKTYFEEDYDRGEQDALFLYGAQWNEGDKEKRRKEGRPCLTENRLMPFVDQVINDIRQSRPSITVSPADDKADVETAKVIKGLVRNIEKVSSADNVYDTAAENAIQSAYGWIRVCVEYSDYETFDQEIKLKRIRNPRSVYIDPSFEEMDASDAEYVFIYQDIEKKKFEKMYPKAQEVSFDADGWAYQRDNKDYVRIAEVYYKEYTTKTIVQGEDGQIYDAKDYDGAVTLTREVEECKVKYKKISGSETLEEEDWPGQYLPIIPVLGKEAWLEGKRHCYSLIHQAKDPQTRLNFWISASTEVLALQPKTPFIGPKGTFDSNRNKWATANRENHAFLEYDLLEDAEGNPLNIPPQRSQPPVGSQAMFQESLAAADGIRNTLGMYAASLGDRGPEMAGIAIQERKGASDNSNYHFVDNLSTAMRHTGRVIIDLIPKVYSEPRILRILGEDGTEEQAPVNQPFVRQGGVKVPVQEAGAPGEGIYALDVGKYDVAVEVGPSYSTKRKEFVDAALQMMANDPEFARVSRDLIVKNMDFPHADLIAERLQSLLPPELQGEDPEQMQLAMAQATIQQMQQQLQEMAQALQNKQSDEKLKRDVEMRKVAVDELKARIDLMKAQAEISQTIPAEAMKDVAQAIAEMDSRIQDASDALEIILNSPDGDGLPSDSPDSQPPQQGGFFNGIAQMFRR